MSTNDLERLPLVDVAPDVAERTLRRALGAFEEEHELHREPAWLSAFHRTSRALVPVAIAGGVGIYLSWAMAAASALYP